MRMISYAQNHEDVILARAFAGVEDGFYVDVGAGHPVYDSVTKHFSDLGWRGINVEPLAEEIKLLDEDRPLDVNLEVALADRPGTARIFAGPPENRGSSTLDAELVESYRARGQDFEERTVVVTTLQSVLEEHADRPIDFLKIDVEGHEELVLGGVDLSAWRPRVVVVEATRPNSQAASHEAWEPRLLDAGYEFRLFDGLNRYYVREEDSADLGPALSLPANVFDDYVPFRFEAEIDGLRAHATALEAALRDAQPALEAASAHARSVEAELHAAQDEVGRLGDEVDRLERAAEAARRVAADEAQRRVVAEKAATDATRELANVYRTMTFRFTSVPRRLYGKILSRTR